VSEDFRTNKAQSRRLYEEVFARGNYDVADSIMAADIITHGPGTPPAVGTEGLKRQAMLLRTAFPDLHVTLNNQLGEGDRIASHWTGSGTHSGPLNLPTGPVEPTGTTIAFDEMRIDRFVDSRIVESWLIPDRMTLWQQLGLLPGPSGMGPVDGPHR
jgi:predicted ester cyclase